jgi:hypothetical protein
MKVEEPAGFFSSLLFPSGIAVSQKSVRKKSDDFYETVFFSYGFMPLRGLPDAAEKSIKQPCLRQEFKA